MPVDRTGAGALDRWGIGTGNGSLNCSCDALLDLGGVEGLVDVVGPDVDDTVDPRRVRSEAGGSKSLANGLANGFDVLDRDAGGVRRAELDDLFGDDGGEQVNAGRRVGGGEPGVERG